MGSSCICSPIVERVFFPFICMQHVDLFCSHLRPIVWIDESDLSWALTVLRALATEVEVNRSVKALNLILNEERNLDVPVLKELVDLLTNDHEVVRLII